MSETAYIAMGSNVGTKAQTLRAALDQMRATPGLTLKRVSSFVETAPVGGPADQPDYLNAVVEIETDLAPTALLAALQTIEANLGRDRTTEQHWGPRTCDLDIVLMGPFTTVDEPGLTVPHPRMHTRRFVLEPLAEIAPRARHPEFNCTVAELLAQLEADS